MSSKYRSVLLKLAASVKPLVVGVAGVMKRAENEYLVAGGDTLSGIAKRYGSSWQDIAKLNGISDPHRISVGQRIRIPQKTTTAGLVGIGPVSRELHRQFNNSDLEAAILANINRETGGTFDYRQKEKGVVKGGYGLFQLTGPNLTAYNQWLSRNKKADSPSGQIEFVRSVYGPGRLGWRKNTAASSRLTREQLADWWHKRVETPAHVLSGKTYNAAKIRESTMAHNDFMKNKIRLVNGVWQGV